MGEAGVFTARGVHELGMMVSNLAEQGFRIVTVIDTQNGDYHVIAQTEHESFCVSNLVYGTTSCDCGALQTETVVTHLYLRSGDWRGETVETTMKFDGSTYRFHKTLEIPVGYDLPSETAPADLVMEVRGVVIGTVPVMSGLSRGGSVTIKP